MRLRDATPLAPLTSKNPKSVATAAGDDARASSRTACPTLQLDNNKIKETAHV